MKQSGVLPVENHLEGSMKTVAIIQSNYIPWKGYIDVIRRVDEFILLDDVQYTRRDWRNRNRIKSPHGPLWLTIPVQVKGKYLQKIKDTQVEGSAWRKQHWCIFCQSYRKAPYFATYKDQLEELWLGSNEMFLSQINHRWLLALCQMMGVTTPITFSMDRQIPTEDPTERLVELCLSAGASVYLSGPAARTYLEEERFRRQGIAVEWMDYSGYPEYSQLHPPFDHYVSVLDLLVSLGPDARLFLERSAHAA
jgi:hypothetical protein